MNMQVGDLVTHLFREREIGLVVDMRDEKVYIEWADDGQVCWYHAQELIGLFNKIS